MRIDTDFSLYGVMILLSLLGGAVGVYILNIYSGIQRKVARYLGIFSMVTSCFGGFLLTFVTSGFQEMGLSSLGGLMGMYAAVLAVSLIVNYQKIGGRMAVHTTLVLPLMYSIGKLGCFGAGCCRGIPYDGMCSVTYTGQFATESGVFPIQLAESVVFFLIFCVGLYCYARQKQYAAPMIFILSAVMKFLLEFLRESHIGQTISLTQILCGICALIGCVWLWIVRSKTNGTAEKI